MKLTLLLSIIAICTGVIMTEKTSEAANSAKSLTQFMKQYQTDFHKMYCDVSYSWWDAMITGNEKAFEKSSQAQLAISTYHSSPEKYNTLKKLIADTQDASPVLLRSAHAALKNFEQNQLPPDLMKKEIEMSNEIEQIFQTQRGVLNGKKYTNNELLEMLEKETDSAKRFAIWDSLKQVGQMVAPKLIKLAEVRNEMARKLGYKNYWEMSVSFQDYIPAELTKIFEELETMTTPYFKAMKDEMDTELKTKFNVDRIMPWHYDNPFFQQAPPSSEVDPNEFYKNFKKEDIVSLAEKFYDSIGLDTRPIVKNSDLFEKPGKSQHGFCNNMNFEGDVRILCNIKPTAEWMDTQLHELGHGVYDFNVDRSLPCNIREACHIFTTEGVAMMFGAMARDPDWLIQFAGADPKRVKEVAPALKKQRLREQLIFCRWTIVMFHFEKMLYENPQRDLNSLWWDTVEKYQMMPRPENRNLGDWASKPHFVIAPVYYHNYMLGELFGAQLRNAYSGLYKKNPKEFGTIMTEKVFAPGNRYPWQEFVEKATGKPFSAKAFADELK